MNEDADKLGGLRKLRENFAKKYDNDPKKMGDYFRRIQKNYKNKVITDINLPEASSDRISV